MSARPLIGAPSKLRNLDTSALMSAVSGWAAVDGGLNGASTSPQRVVLTVSGAETAVQLASLPMQLAATFSTS